MGVAPVLNDIYDPQHLSATQLNSIENLEEEEEGIKESITPLKSPLMVDTKNRKSFLTYGSGEYYPTVQRTCYILGKLYGSVPVRIFFNFYFYFICFLYMYR